MYMYVHVMYSFPWPGYSIESASVLHVGSHADAGTQARLHRSRFCF